MLDFHKANKADVTIACMPVPIEEASRFGIMVTDDIGRITEFEEKPEHPSSNLASMGIYIFSWPALKIRTAVILANMFFHTARRKVKDFSPTNTMDTGRM